MTASGTIDVVIPVFQRPEACLAVFSLLAQGSMVNRIFLIDASPDGRISELIVQLANESGRVVAVRCPSSSFSRPKCLNAGLRLCEAPLTLVSDADIIWFNTTVRQMCTVVNSTNGLCHVESVEETDQKSRSLSRPGYDYRVIVKNAHQPLLHIIRRTTLNGVRSGPGLVLASTDCWNAIGGYCEDFVGWGWEDKDLLIRAALSGKQVDRAGRVLHLSHDDTKRNTSFDRVEPARSRNANILTSVSRIARGELNGDLAGGSSLVDKRPPVTICFEDGVEAELSS
ncbi:glycosyltransferase family 2 protein [Azospirillum aestuarii]|uniref:glycosyltransferase family 2 protein n=1 Tax=Azospirillum aestuarii TaxID=2802052 RepID=UPI004054B83B